MPSDNFEQLLDRAASLFGIEPEFWDIFGTHHITTREAKRAILSALGVATDSSEALERSLADLARLEWERLLPPAVVAEQTGSIELPICVTSENLGQSASFKVTREDGGAAEFEISLWDLPQTGSIEMDGHTW